MVPVMSKNIATATAAEATTTVRLGVMGARVTVYGTWTDDQVKAAVAKALAVTGRATKATVQRMLDLDTLLTAKAGK